MRLCRALLAFCLTSGLTPLGRAQREGSTSAVSDTPVAASAIVPPTHFSFRADAVPIKQALAWQNRMTAEVRLPLCELATSSQDKLRATLKNLSLLS